MGAKKQQQHHNTERQTRQSAIGSQKPCMCQVRDEDDRPRTRFTGNNRQQKAKQRTAAHNNLKHKTRSHNNIRYIRAAVTAGCS